MRYQNYVFDSYGTLGGQDEEQQMLWEKMAHAP